MKKHCLGLFQVTLEKMAKPVSQCCYKMPLNSYFSEPTAGSNGSSKQSMTPLHWQDAVQLCGLAKITLWLMV